MKILVISVLRLGDLLMALPAIASLKRTHRNSTIHVLANKPASRLAGLLVGVDEIIEVDHTQIQENLARIDRPIFDVYDKLKDQVQALNENGYDLVVNLTHNKASALWTSLVEGKEKIGVHYADNGQVIFGSTWFRALDERAAKLSSATFHYSDYLKHGTRGRNSSSPTEKSQDNQKISMLCESPEGKKAAAAHVSDWQEYLCIQPLTSDSKKNWGLQNWEDFIIELSLLRPKTKYIILCAPSEQISLEDFTKRLMERSLAVRQVACDFPTALSLIKGAAALVTGDTSIMHLAALAGTSIVEVSIGSSNFDFTGPYCENAILVQAKISCAPCGHSTPCKEKSHLCAEKVSAAGVASTVLAKLDGSLFDLRAVASEFGDQFLVYKTQFDSNGMWTANPLMPIWKPAQIRQRIERSAWILLHEGADKQAVAPFGTAARDLAVNLKATFSERTPADWRAMMGELEAETFGLEDNLRVLESQVDFIVRKNPNGDRLLSVDKALAEFKLRILSFDGHEAVAKTLEDMRPNKGTSEFSFFRKTKEKITELRRYADIRRRIIRSLQNEIVEVL